jgi:hypothetical protein
MIGWCMCAELGLGDLVSCGELVLNFEYGSLGNSRLARIYWFNF